YD
ncbi:putative oxidoreductase domain protein, partial [Vibrio parahaemolyticus AQ3810]